MAGFRCASRSLAAMVRAKPAVLRHSKKPPSRVASGTAADLPGAWPGFRGPNRDAISPDDTPLAETWADRRTQAAVGGGCGRRLRRSRRAQRPGLSDGLRPHSPDRRPALPLARGWPGDLEIFLSVVRQTQPRDVAHRARRHRQIRGGPRPEVPRQLPRCGERQIPVGHRSGAGNTAPRCRRGMRASAR